MQTTDMSKGFTIIRYIQATPEGGHADEQTLLPTGSIYR